MRILSRASAYLLPFIIGFVLAWPAVAPAADRIWDGEGANDNWSTPANWDGNLAAPASGDSLTFDGALRLTPNNNLAADSLFGPITLAPGAGPYTIGGNRITLAGNVTNSSPNAQALNLAMILNDHRTVTVDGGPLTLGGVISGDTFGLVKAGPGQLILGANNTYTGPTVIDGGTLTYAVDSPAVAGISFGPTPTDTTAGVNAGNLDLATASLTTTSLTAQTTSATPNTINIGDGKTLTVNGAFTVGVAEVFANANPGVTTNLTVTGNALTVNGGAGHFIATIGRSNAASGADAVANVDLAGLTNFAYTGTTGEFRVGAGNARATMLLANTANTITAAQVRVGDSGATSSGNNNGGRSVLRLGGGTNVINTPTLILGAGKSAGTLDFQGGSGTLTIAGAAGGTSTANITLGSSTSATGSGDDTRLFLDGHDVTVQGNTVVVGRLAGGTGGNSARANVTFDTGTFNAVNLHLGVNSSGSAPNGASGTFTLGGPSAGSAATGVLNVTGQFFLANRTNTNGAAGPSTGAFVINGGTANVSTDILDASTTTANAGPNQTTLTLDGGTLNMSGRNIGSQAAPITNVNLNSGTLNNPGTIAANNINLNTSVTVTGAPTYLLGDGGTLNSALAPLTLASGGGLGGGGAGGAIVNGDVAANAGSRVTPGATATAATLSFSNALTLNTGSNVRFKLTDNTGSGNDAINVAGPLTLNGTVNLEIGSLGAGPVAGNTYTLFNYSGGLTGDQSNLNVVGFGSRATFTVVPTATTPGSIQLTVGGGTPLALTWLGNASANWDRDATTNWRDASATPQKFFNLDTVTFDDNSTNPADVQLVGQLAPASIAVAAARNYKFAGAGSITGSTGIVKNGAGTLVVATDNTYTGSTDINEGTLQVGDGGTTGSLGTGQVNNFATLAFNRGNDAVVTNPITGSGTVIKNGAGRLTLAGASTYDGPTQVNAGTVVVTNNASLGALPGGAVTIASGAALDLAGNTGTNNANFGAKQFNIAGTGVGGTGALTNSGTVNQQNAFQNVVLTANASVGGTGRFDIRGGTPTLDLAGFDLTKVGTNQFTLVGVNVTDGNIVVNSGRFAIETTSSILDNATGKTITYNASTIPTDVTRAQFFNLSGTVTRPMVFNGDGIEIGNASNATQPSTVASNITLNGSVTVTNLNNSAGALTLNGIISETGGPRSITKTGPTSLTLGGANTYSGATNVLAGTLVVTGSIANSPVTVADGATFDAAAAQTVKQLTLALGGRANVTAGVLTVGNNTAPSPLVNAGTIELNANGLVVNYEGAAAGAANLAAVRAQVTAGFNAGTWTGPTGIISANAAADASSKGVGYALASDVLGAAGGTFMGAPVDGTAVLARYTLLGDATVDGNVDFNDLVKLAQNYNVVDGTRAWSTGDFTYDGNTDFNDLVKLAQNYNTTLPTEPIPGASLSFQADLAAAFAAVPEPGALSLLALAACGFAARRRR